MGGLCQVEQFTSGQKEHMRNLFLTLGKSGGWLGGGVVVGSLVFNNGVYIGLGLLFFSIIFLVIGKNWERIARFIPCERIKQDANPNEYIFPEISRLDNSILVMFSRMRDQIKADYVYVFVDMRSNLDFDVDFTSLRGYVIINNSETTPPEAILEILSDIELPKRTTKIIRWRLEIKESSCEAPLMGGVDTEGRPSTVRLRVKGIDSKGRQYRWVTNEFES